jgi:hypothetical protein
MPLIDWIGTVAVGLFIISAWWRLIVSFARLQIETGKRQLRSVTGRNLELPEGVTLKLLSAGPCWILRLADVDPPQATAAGPWAFRIEGKLVPRPGRSPLPRGWAVPMFKGLAADQRLGLIDQAAPLVRLRGLRDLPALFARRQNG